MTRLPIARSNRGFSLIEILVVIALIAGLAAMSIAGIRVAQKRAKTKDSATRLAMLVSCLEGYNTDNAEYPEPVSWDRMGQSKTGESWRAGGAACLYQALTGDGTSEIQGFTAKAGQNSGASTGDWGSSGRSVYIKDAGKTDNMVFKDGENYYIVDTFGVPFSYRKYDKAFDAEMNNEKGYDLWSYGGLESQDDSDSAKKGWIKNWH